MRAFLSRFESLEPGNVRNAPYYAQSQVVVILDTGQ